ncbi:MAG: hypothetical protein KDC35_21040 [Acidobacteria bacterium]|nr:hypothetical protein [Acidobacteriota bacterium]
MRNVIVMGCLTVLVGLPGCRQLVPYCVAPPEDVPRLTNEATIILKERSANTYPIQATLFDGSSVPAIPFVTNDPNQTPLLYSDQPYRPEGTLPNLVKGNFLLPLRHQDAAVSISNYLQISSGLQNSKKLLVAFDQRAITVPLWLSQSFTLIPGQEIQSSERYLGVDPNTGQPILQPVRFNLWIYTGQATLPSSISLGGNNQGSQWQDGAVGSQYLVLVEKSTVLGPGPARQVGTQKVFSCDSAEAAVSQKQSFLYQWANRHPEYMDAYDEGWLDLTFAPAWQVASTSAYCQLFVGGNCDGGFWPVGTRLQASSSLMDPSSAIVNGQSRLFISMEEHGQWTSLPPATLSGDISFSLEPGVLKLGGMTLDSPAVQFPSLQFDQIQFEWVGEGAADCDDGLPIHEARLCNEYSIPSDDMALGVTFTVNGSQVRTIFKSTQPAQILVDHNQRQFVFLGGPFTGSLESRDLFGSHPINFEANLECTVDFDNFSPVPSLAETPRFVPCSDQNRALVTLDARASIDFDESVGDSFQTLWIEDAGTRSESILGSGDTLTRVFRTGTHSLMVQLTDSRGAISQKSFLLDVVDTAIDQVMPPPMVIQPFEGQAIEDVPPVAHDLCSDLVGITRVGPELFPRGLSWITWTLDDYNGNVQILDQAILLVDPDIYPPPQSHLQAPNQAYFGQSFPLDWQVTSPGREVDVDIILLVLIGQDRWYVTESGQLWSDLAYLAMGVSSSSGLAGTCQLEDSLHELGLTGPVKFQMTLVMAGSDPFDPAETISFAQTQSTLLE